LRTHRDILFPDSIVRKGQSRFPGAIFAREYAWLVGSMAEYPKLEYSQKDVRRAGSVICANVWSPENRDGILEAFCIANNWRDSHLYPMRSTRVSIAQRMRWKGLKGYTAARPKRMISIRRKLRRLTINLEQINDIAGCRAVLDDVATVNKLIDICENDFPQAIRQRYPYINKPKPDGYRSHHIVFDFQDEGVPDAFKGRRVELQIRTRLQHSWATAVEAVGIYRNEEMKQGEGDPDWLRLFQLMSLEFAYAEKCDPLGPDNDQAARLAEIKKLNAKLGAASVLEDLRNATHYMSNFASEITARYYLIRYDNQTKQVTVTGFSSAFDVSAALAAAEQKIETGEDDAKVVQVEVGKVASLVEAYPNYFGDVALFIRNLRHVCDGKEAIEFSMAPQKLVAPKPYEKPDLGAIRRIYTQWR
jgi:Region found in RelA / SpoT proteins